MGKKRLSKEEYLERIRGQVSHLPPEKVDEILKRLDVNNIDKLIERGEYCYILKGLLKDDPDHLYIKQNPSKVRYYAIPKADATVICVKVMDDMYNVAFSFRRWDDSYSYSPKYVKTNYILSRWRYNFVKATSSITAVCIAWNKNRANFPGLANVISQIPRSGMILSPNLFYNKMYDKVFGWKNRINRETIDVKDIDQRYKIACKNLVDMGIDPTKVRYYNRLFRTSIMVVKSGEKYDVTFSFTSPEDVRFLDQHGNNVNTKKLDKITLIQNRIDNKYTYTVDAPNSVTAAVWAYNKNNKDFPSDFVDTRIHVSPVAHVSEDQELKL